LKIDFLR